MDRVLGQSAALKALRTQLANQRVHHAQIFHGPAGVGKFTTAIDFARELLCHEPVSDLIGNLSACGTCRSCKLFRMVNEAQQGEDPTENLASAHPDLHIITKELALFSDDAQERQRKLTSIPVSVIREHLIAPASLAPALNHGKVFIVDEAELLNSTGQNALLKTLEEPTPGTYLILVTSSEHKLLATIRSRCQRIAFSALADEDIARWIGEHHGEVDEQTRKWVVGFAQGSLGRASLALRFDLVQWGASVLSPMQRLMQSGRPEPTLGQSIGDCVDGFASAWVTAHKNASKEAANRRAAMLMGSMISHFARRRMAEKAHQCDRDLPGECEQTLSPWLQVIEAVTAFEDQLASNVNLKLCCEGLGMAIHGALLGVAGRS